MSTRRKINKILNEKGLSAEVEYDGKGASMDECGWWTVKFDKDSTDFVNNSVDYGFCGVIEFCEIDCGLLELSELPCR